MEGKKQFARAAALAVFNLEIRMALQILEKVNSEEETLVAMGNFDCGVFNWKIQYSCGNISKYPYWNEVTLIGQNLSLKCL